jgi:hypothetical protein
MDDIAKQLLAELEDAHPGSSDAEGSTVHQWLRDWCLGTDPMTRAERIAFIRSGIDGLQDALNGAREALDTIQGWPASRTFVARFDPQAWVRDQAIDVDPEGEQEWTPTLDDMPADYRAGLIAEIDEHGQALDGDDWLKSDPAAPEWVREYHGPFSIWLRYA